MTKICYVDIETTTWFSQDHIKDLPRDLQLLGMEFGLAVTWDNYWDSSRFETWGPDDINHLWDYLLGVDLICGYNIIAFDLPIIARSAGITLQAGKSFPRVYDLFDIIKRVTNRWYRLEDLLQANLGEGKTADGLQAAKWLAEGGQENYEKAMKYCLKGVELEVKLGELARDGNHILLPKTEKYYPEMYLTLDWEKGQYQLTGKL